MGEEFKDFTTTPTLTFGETPDAQELPSTVAEETEVVADPAFNENNLTAEEKKMVEDFSQKIDLHNSQAILQYGAGTQKKMADFSENALKNVRTKDMGEVGDMLSGLVVELKSFEITEEDKGILGLFKKSANKVTGLKAKYDKTETNVNNVCQALEKHQVTLMKDIALLDKMYDANLSYFKELSMYIIAGKQKLEEVRNGELAEAKAKAQASNLPEDAQAAKESAILKAEAEKEKMIREAEGEAAAILKVQQANADGIRFLKEAGADERVLTLKSFEAMAKIADGQATKIIIPSEMQNLAGSIKAAVEVAKEA